LKNNYKNLKKSPHTIHHISLLKNNYKNSKSIPHHLIPRH
jgi:hypothetical protein